MVGSAICRALARAGFPAPLAPCRSEVDWESRDETFEYLHETRPDTVFICAARVGGIFDNAAYPEQFLVKNLAIATNLLTAAAEFEARRVMFFGSSCIYPREAQNPIQESALLTGPLEKTNEAYALAKIAGLKLAQYLGFVSVMPTNLYGPGDQYRDAARAHVIPALISKLHDAARSGQATFQMRGTGTARREFLHCDDLADVCVSLIQNPSLTSRVINIGSGEELSVRELAGLIAETVGFRGTLVWDQETFWDGTPQKKLDCSLLRAITDWTPRHTLRTGLPTAYQSFLDSRT